MKHITTYIQEGVLDITTNIDKANTSANNSKKAMELFKEWFKQVFDLDKFNYSMYSINDQRAGNGLRCVVHIDSCKQEPGNGKYGWYNFTDYYRELLSSKETVSTFKQINKMMGLKTDEISHSHKLSLKQAYIINGYGNSYELYVERSNDNIIFETGGVFTQSAKDVLKEKGLLK